MCKARNPFGQASRRLQHVSFYRQQNTPSDPNTSLLSPQSATSCKSLASSFSGIKSPLSPITPVLSPTSKLVPNPLNPGLKTPNILSPNTPNSSTNKSKRRRDRENRKNSQHYQESDILDSYYRSSPADKISDYEDIWNTTDQSNHSTWSPNENTKSSSKDNNRIACTPLDRLRSSNDRLMTPHERIVSPGERSLNDRLPGEQMQVLRNDRFILRNDKLSYKETTNPELSSFKPAPELRSPADQGSPEETGMGKRPDLLSRVCECTFPSRQFGLHFEISRLFVQIVQIWEYVKISVELSIHKFWTSGNLKQL